MVVAAEWTMALKTVIIASVWCPPDSILMVQLCFSLEGIKVCTTGHNSSRSRYLSDKTDVIALELSTNSSSFGRTV